MNSLEAVSNPRIVCPRCGHAQDDSVECHGCGIIFGKFSGQSGYQTMVFRGVQRVRVRKVIEWKKLGILLCLLIVLWVAVQEFWTSVEIRHPPGVLVPAEPQQVVIRNGRPWEKADRLIFPLADFQLTARVLSRERYRFDAQSDLSPVDLALGWGLMSDQQMIDKLDIAQSSRFYVVAPRQCSMVIPWPLVMRSSANMHMIPADDDVKERLLNLRPGSIIHLKGHLVGVQMGGRWVWVSSLSRTDTGDGACEILWVKQLSVL
ncbi:MAG: hypothetical protein HGA84_02620 [Syntrophobacteraceae bacterium]|nr:hypothetical protein [Syntrophobacteraceae bacterium]